MSEWIKCSESLPIERESWDITSTINVLIYSDDGAIQTGFWSYEALCWFDYLGNQIEEDEFDRHVTHWMPLPAPPSK